MKRESFFLILCTFLLVFGVSDVFATSTSTPSPCSIIDPGCYDTNGREADYYSLPWDLFGYAYVEEVCSSGSCSCTLDKSTTTGKVEEPDEHQNACQCIIGADWSGRACCGDDNPGDCGLITTEGVLCAPDTDYEDSSWHDDDESLGDIVYAGCNDKEYLSTGSTWIRCDGFSDPRAINGHSYVCSASSGEGSWVECCGSATCNSETAGLRLSTGESIQDENGEPYYCTYSKTFARDLDTTDKATCEGAGFTWTGTKCCGEPEDGAESYNDETGGCFEGEPVVSVSYLDWDSKDVVNFAGQFFGCQLSSDYNTDNNYLLNEVSTYTGEQLITDLPYCTFDQPNQQYFCSYTEQWLPTYGEERSSFSSLPEEYITSGVQESECCEPSQCWDGEECVDDQSDSQEDGLLGDYRCVNGQWIIGGFKKSPDGSEIGYCPYIEQCLVSTSGNANHNNQTISGKNPQCITSGQYLWDDYCDSGEWSSRTRNIALTLLQNKESENFILVCDMTGNTLNEVDYATEDSQTEASVYLSSANNICILKRDDQSTVLGISFNDGITSTMVSDLFGVTSCSSADEEDGYYHPCDSGHKLWYNAAEQSLIYSADGITISSGETGGITKSLLRSLWNSLVTSLTSSINSDDDPAYNIDSSYESIIPKFKRLYYLQEDGKTILGTLDEEGSETYGVIQHAVLEYSGFTSTDICSYTNLVTSHYGDSNAGIECIPPGQGSTTYRLLLQGQSLTTFLPEDVWADLTAKVRVQ